MTLTAEQRRALLDVLTHHQTYSEIQAFQRPEAVINYGEPFEAIDDDGDGGRDSGSPILQMLLTRFILPLPGIRQLPDSFWRVQVQGLLARLAEAELSESYDRGALGSRKTLATGSSALLEMVARGCLGGLARDEEGTRTKTKTKTTTTGDGDDDDDGERLTRAWDEVLQGLVYGDLVDELFDHISQTDDIEGYSPVVASAIDYIIIHLAGFAHSVFIRSAEGQYLLKLVSQVHGMVPYKLLKQTMRIGNAATMMSGLSRLLLAKLSVASVTNWFGLTQKPDDGMNLVQRIVSLVLAWDAADFRKSAERVEKAKADGDGPPDEALSALRRHLSATRRVHDEVRERSREEGRSIVAEILGPDITAGLSEAQHAQCLDFYSALWSIRDRDAMAAALCRTPPDLFTQAIKDVMGAYEGLIRSVHSRVDLREHLDATQGFIDDFIRASRPSGGEPPSVADYVRLLRRNRRLLYRWLHVLGRNCPDVREALRTWSKESIVRFRKPPVDDDDLDAGLDALIENLPDESRRKILLAIDEQASYLASLSRESRTRLSALVNNENSTVAAPGAYLARWQALLDATAVTPSTPSGKLRRGRDVKHMTAMGKTGLGGWKVERVVEGEGPDLDFVVERLRGGFGDLLFRLRRVR
ncbi:hypothetical protein CP533_3315 [Ophiocordyceps camponoti-saundersi (nom. inval.)]|nr:hypothetical protein CP533_3315 [Ophiocordyceps camponoti-saundersi (nom. inval.)]